MDILITLSPVELERLLITIESSQQVHRRNQYFLWSQGALQSFLPHDVLVFGHGEYGTPSFRCEVLARNNSWEDRALHGELNRLVQMMVDSWQNGGHLPRLFTAINDANNPGDCAISHALNRLGLGHALAHGAKEFPGDCSGFFVFMRMAEAPGRRHAYFAEMLMPYLHTTLHRMLQLEKTLPEHRLRPGLTLSTREAQVISLVRDGNTNQQIAVVLGLSPLTVKNHVQNVLRKLEVANRAQAVAKAVKARLIGDAVGS
jgi:transcriptional regulator EpsA